MRLRLVIVSLASLLLVPACGNRHIRDTLNDIDTFIEDCPDSAFAFLTAIRAEDLGGKAQRAHYSLLYAKARDKNSVDDSTGVDTIMPAVECSGGADE